MPQTDVALSIKDLHVVFGNKVVLKGVNLEVEHGQIIGYIGPNGAGKSTTIKAILGLVKDYAGEIRIFDHAISAGVRHRGNHFHSYLRAPGHTADDSCRSQHFSVLGH